MTPSEAVYEVRVVSERRPSGHVAVFALPPGGWALEIETGHEGHGVFVGIRRKATVQREITTGIGAKGARKLAKLLLQAADASDLADSIPRTYSCRFCDVRGDSHWLGTHICPDDPALVEAAL